LNPEAEVRFGYGAEKFAWSIGELLVARDHRDQDGVNAAAPRWISM
jgi:hypothetical protein